MKLINDKIYLADVKLTSAVSYEDNNYIIQHTDYLTNKLNSYLALESLYLHNYIQ